MLSILLNIYLAFMKKHFKSTELKPFLVLLFLYYFHVLILSVISEGMKYFFWCEQHCSRCLENAPVRQSLET
jgi:hypothetical protein